MAKLARDRKPSIATTAAALATRTKHGPCAMTHKPLSESGIVILGGTAGVGLETAFQFVGQGSRVALLGRNPKRGGAACRLLRERGSAPHVRFIQVAPAFPP